MNESIKNGLVTGVVAALVILAVTFASGLVSGQLSLGASGFTRYPNSSVSARCFNTSPTSTTNCIDGSGSFSGEVSAAGIRNSSGTTVGAGDTVSQIAIGTATYNPPSLASSSNINSNLGLNVTSTQVSVPNASLGAACTAGLSSVTSTGRFFFTAFVSGATGGTSTVVLSNWENVAIDHETGTLKVVCVE